MKSGWMLGGRVEQKEYGLPAGGVNFASLRLAGRAKAPVATCAVAQLNQAVGKEVLQ